VYITKEQTSLLFAAVVGMWDRDQ